MFSTLPEELKKQILSLPVEISEQILSFLNDSELVELTNKNPQLSVQSHFVLQDRLKAELALFGINRQHLQTANLNILQLFQLRCFLYALEHHDLYAAKALAPQIEEIRGALETLVTGEQKEPIIRYLTCIFEALSQAKIPIIEQTPTFLAELGKENQPRLVVRIKAIHLYARNNPACIPMFAALAADDQVAHWYLYQIYRLGLCGENKDLAKAQMHLQAITDEYAKSPEFIPIYLKFLSNQCLNGNTPEIDQRILGLPGCLTDEQRRDLAKHATYHQFSKPL